MAVRIKQRDAQAVAPDLEFRFVFLPVEQRAVRQRTDRPVIEPPHGRRNACSGEFGRNVGAAPCAVGQHRHVKKPPRRVAPTDRQRLDALYINVPDQVPREVDEMRTRGNSFCASELYRLHGEALRALARPDRAEAERAIREALGLAGKQSCRPLELRAATSLAGLLHDTGRATEGRDVLAPVYAAFTEGFDRPDLQAAKVLLLELN